MPGFCITTTLRNSRGNFYRLNFGTSTQAPDPPIVGQSMGFGPTIATGPMTLAAILREHTQIFQRDVLNYMKSYWLDINGNHESFWAHEWGKHGTCMRLSRRMISWAAGIYPSSTATYTLAQINAAVKAKWAMLIFPDAPKAGTCGSTGIKYPLKGVSNTPTTTATAPTGTSTAIPTKATIVGVTSSGTQTGCLLTAGTWSVQTCATYTITNVSGGFTLKTSKVEGHSAVVVRFQWGSFHILWRALAYSGSTAFTGDSVPSGTAQVIIYTGSSHAQDITFKIVSS
ncbi:RNase T2 family [Rhizoctonia solani]|uniref:ribonuclease T2 n=1 Tax=Rhizoctonia solani TaxID=456999 RepID=A0A8H7IGR8_9AGAM|nr:RNase T2 family [Rhizoctonia solani]